MSKKKRPYPGMRGDYVLEQRDPRSGVWTALVGGAEPKLLAEKRLYPGETRITPNRPGDPLRKGSYRVNDR